MAQRLIPRRGSHFWDFLTTFIAARRVFMSIYRRYERRVLKAALNLRQGFDEVSREIEFGYVPVVDTFDDPRCATSAGLDRHEYDENSGRGQDR